MGFVDTGNHTPFAFNLNDGNEFIFDLLEERLSLGRNPRNEIVIDNNQISSFHAEFVRQPDGEYVLTDLKSSNGTFVNQAGDPIGKGANLKPLMAEILGKATGVCKGRGGSMHFTDAAVGSIGESAIVGGGIPIATGAALSAQVRGSGPLPSIMCSASARHIRLV